MSKNWFVFKYTWICSPFATYSISFLYGAIHFNNRTIAWNTQRRLFLFTVNTKLASTGHADKALHLNVSQDIEINTNYWKINAPLKLMPNKSKLRCFPRHFGGNIGGQPWQICLFFLFLLYQHHESAFFSGGGGLAKYLEIRKAVYIYIATYIYVYICVYILCISLMELYFS